MNTHSNTPPDGDFVRYLERLTTGDLAVAEVKQSLAVTQPRAVSAKNTAALATTTTSYSQTNAADSPDQAQIAMERLAVHLKWAAVILGVTQILGFLVPGMGYLLLPALAAYAWYAIKIRPADKTIAATLVQRLRNVAAQQAAVAQPPGALLRQKKRLPK